VFLLDNPVMTLWQAGNGLDCQGKKMERSPTILLREPGAWVYLSCMVFGALHIRLLHAVYNSAHSNHDAFRCFGSQWLGTQLTTWLEKRRRANNIHSDWLMYFYWN
jgi:hypothetical protein